MNKYKRIEAINILDEIDSKINIYILLRKISRYTLIPIICVLLYLYMNQYIILTLSLVCFSTVYIIEITLIELYWIKIYKLIDDNYDILIEYCRDYDNSRKSIDINILSKAERYMFCDMYRSSYNTICDCLYSLQYPDEN